MAKRKRNYKAEYAREKAKALSEGYSGTRQKKTARRALFQGDKSYRRATVRFADLPAHIQERVSGSDMARLRREAKAWSDAHSWVKASRYSARMGNQQVRDYHLAYVQRADHNLSRRKKAIQKRNRIYDYLVKYGFQVDGDRGEEWKSERAPA